MKPNHHDWLRRNEGELLAGFGDARLIKHLDGKLELIGGSPADHTAAKEWISLFLHSAVVTFVPPRPRALEHPAGGVCPQESSLPRHPRREAPQTNARP
jgi:hypothetical protein